jgi:hypothetical protein
LDVATINYKSRRIGPAPIAIRFLHQVAGRVDNRRIDTGWRISTVRSRPNPVVNGLEMTATERPMANRDRLDMALCANSPACASLAVCR